MNTCTATRAVEKTEKEKKREKERKRELERIREKGVVAKWLRKRDCKQRSLSQNLLEFFGTLSFFGLEFFRKC